MIQFNEKTMFAAKYFEKLFHTHRKKIEEDWKALGLTGALILLAFVLAISNSSGFNFQAALDITTPTLNDGVVYNSWLTLESTDAEATDTTYRGDKNVELFRTKVTANNEISISDLSFFVAGNFDAIENSFWSLVDENKQTVYKTPVGIPASAGYLDFPGNRGATMTADSSYYIVLTADVKADAPNGSMQVSLGANSMYAVEDFNSFAPAAVDGLPVNGPTFEIK